jgi:hypothetical protein
MKTSWCDGDGKLLCEITFPPNDKNDRKILIPGEDEILELYSFNLGDHGETWVLHKKIDGSEIARYKTKYLESIGFYPVEK